MSNELFDNVLSFATVLAPVVLALVQLLKTVPNIPKNSIPFIGLIVGVLVGAVAYPFTDLHVTERLWAGGLSGLTATGLYELVFSKRDGATKDDKPKQI